MPEDAETIDGSGAVGDGSAGQLAAGIVAWREGAAAAFPPELSFRRRAELLGVAGSTYRGWMEKNQGPSTEAMLRFHLRTTFKIGQQVRALFGIGEHEFDVRLPLWEPRFTAEYLIENLRTMLLKSRTTAPSVVDLGEALTASCRASGDPGRWRVRHFDVPGGWHFPHIAFEAVEFMRWYGPNTGIDDDPDADRAEEFLGVDDPSVPRRDWERFMTPKPLMSSIPPATFEPAVRAQDRELHWGQFRFERAELNMRLEQIRHASRTGWIGGYGNLHTPLLRHSESATGRHIAMQPLVRPDDPHQAQAVPVADDQQVRTIAILGTRAVSVGTLANWLADALGWTWVSVEELNHRHSGQRLLLSDRDQRDLMPAVYSAFAARPFPRTVLSAPLAWLQQLGTNGEDGDASPMPEAVELMSSPYVLPILVRPTRETLALWEMRQSFASAEGYRPSPLNRASRVEAMYDVWERCLTSIPGAVVADVTPSLPWSGEAVIRHGEDDSAAPAFYQHPLLGDLLLRVTYELGVSLRSTQGICVLRTGRTRRMPNAEDAMRVLRAARPGRGGGPRPTGFAPASLVAEHELALRAATIGAQWEDDDHLRWDPAYEARPDPRSKARQGRVLRLRLAGQQLRSD